VLVIRALILVACMALSSPLASACTCRNNTPVQKTNGRYAEAAVFTARVVHSIGKVYDFNGARSSDRVVAIVHRRYWGFPSFWPGLVILDGSGLCGIGMLEGEEYFVTAYRSERYGVFLVGGCSRTQPIDAAPVDLRTLDGSHCASPGGTLIGHVSFWRENQPGRTPVRNARLTFRNSSGGAYVTQSDEAGIYELRHPPTGSYTLDSQIGNGLYALGGGEVINGVCKEAPVLWQQSAASAASLPTR
jgi:hypothetical protein